MNELKINSKTICDIYYYLRRNELVHKTFSQAIISLFLGLDGSEVHFVGGRDGLPIYTINNFQQINDTIYEWVNVATFSYGKFFTS